MKLELHYLYYIYGIEREKDKRRLLRLGFWVLLKLNEYFLNCGGLTMFYTDQPMTGRMANFMYKVYMWMAAALCISGGVAYYVAMTPSLYIAIARNPILLFGIIIAQFAAVIALAGWVQQMSFAQGLTIFLGYAALSGLTLSSVLVIYTAASVYSTFAVTAGMFGIMALYGYFSKADLTAMGNIAIMGLWGLILGMFINMFLGSASFDYALSAIGVLIFTVLIAFDVQKLKNLGAHMITDDATMNKVSLLGALTLYLDFINLFLYLLRFMGNKRRD